MSVNTAHASNGVLIHAGEYILLLSENVSMDFSGQDDPVFKGTKYGRIYLTSHRMIFNSKKANDLMQSFSAPFIALSDVELEQPVFGANYIKGKVRAQPGGHFIGEVKFKLYFKSGGAIEYGQALLRAARTAQNNMVNSNYPDNPPPYTPAGSWYEAPPPAYQLPPGYYGWLPQHEAFTNVPPNTVFMSELPPPYPGIGGPPPYRPANIPPPQPVSNQNQTSNVLDCAPVRCNNDSPVSWNGFSLPPDEPQQQQQQHVTQQSAPPPQTASPPQSAPPQQQHIPQQQAPHQGWQMGAQPPPPYPPPYGGPPMGYAAPAYNAPPNCGPVYGGGYSYGAPNYGAPGYGPPLPGPPPPAGFNQQQGGYYGGNCPPGYGNPNNTGGGMGFNAPPNY